MRSWPTASEDDRAQLRLALSGYVAMAATTTDAGLITEAHLQIHRGLVGLTGSERLLSAFDALAAEIRLALAHLDRVRGNLKDQIAEHTLLVELLEDDTVEAAVAELHRHLAIAEASLLAETGHGTIAS
jgi:DNA-binding GntR family transcriptional regulator